MSFNERMDSIIKNSGTFRVSSIALIASILTLVLTQEPLIYLPLFLVGLFTATAWFIGHSGRRNYFSALWIAVFSILILSRYELWPLFWYILIFVILSFALLILTLFIIERWGWKLSKRLSPKDKPRASVDKV